MKALFIALGCAWSLYATVAVAQQQQIFVLVHGAFGGSWSFKHVDAQLSAKGHTVYRPCLTGLGERMHLASTDIDLYTHIQDVVNTILFEDLHGVILLGHSYGGMVITGVADSIPERIKRLVYLDAILPNDGESASTSPINRNGGLEQMAKNGFLTPVWVGEVEPLPHDVPHPIKTLTQPVSRKNQRALSLPAVYILTVDPGRNPKEDDFFPFAVRAREREWPTRTMVADHNPQLTNADELVELLHMEAYR